VIWVGTSGWLYDHWDGTFYPKGLPRARWGAYYRSQFPVVELNATFYRLPRGGTILKWLREASGGFRYVVKGSRYITHIRRLSDCDEPVSRFIKLITPLHPALLALLWQLPPNLQRDDALLARFIDLLPPTLGDAPLRHAIEFRHRSWIADPVHDLLAAHGITNVWISSTAMPADFPRTADFVYARFHGLEGGWKHDYTVDELRPFASALTSAGCDGVAFFNNDGDGRAPHNAELFTQMLGDAAVAWDPPPEALNAGRRRA
jgi:uncharacterized protein YecE (DUF72 family)